MRAKALQVCPRCGWELPWYWEMFFEDEVCRRCACEIAFAAIRKPDREGQFLFEDDMMTEEQNEILLDLANDANALLGMTVGLIAGVKNAAARGRCEEIFDKFVATLSVAQNAFEESQPLKRMIF